MSCRVYCPPPVHVCLHTSIEVFYVGAVWAQNSNPESGVSSGGALALYLVNKNDETTEHRVGTNRSNLATAAARLLLLAHHIRQHSIAAAICTRPPL